MNESNGKRIVQVVDYDPDWPEMYQREIRKIHAVLGKQIAAAHHIGSTSVPGLKAKPIIDILLEVYDINALDAFDSQMKQLGYIPKGEYGIPGRRYYHKGPVHRTHHIHAFNAESPGAKRHLAFRDYLIAHPSVAEQYGLLKTGIAAACQNDMERYCDGKNDFVKEHECKALAWVNLRYTQLS